MAPLTGSVTVPEELERTYKKMAGHAKALQNYFFPQAPQQDPSTLLREFEEACSRDALFEEICDGEDEEWTDVVEDLRNVPTENHEESYRLTCGPGPIQQTAVKLQEKALEAALESAGFAGDHVKSFMQNVARDTGWLLHCKTVEEYKDQLVVQYPILKAAGQVAKDLGAAYVMGMEMAREGRGAASAYLTKQTGGLGAPVEAAGLSKRDCELGIVKSKPVDPAEFAGEFMEVPLEEEEKEDYDLVL